MENPISKKLLAAGVAILVLAIGTFIFMQMRDSASGPATIGGEEETGGLADVSQIPAEELAPAPVAANATPEAAEILKEAVIVAQGANPITKDNKVVTADGQQTDTAARPMSDTAPKQTGFLDAGALPEGLVKISVGNGKFSPAEFRTKAGAATSFSLSGADSFSHVLVFDDPSLSAVTILVGPGQTKAITFNAPAVPGRYTFRNDSPGRTETGVMIVE